MIDLHCHVDLYPRPATVIAEIARRGMYVLAVTTTPRSFQANRIFAGENPKIRVAVGLHPELVAERSHEVSEVCSLVEMTKYVGEIGVDGSSQHRHSVDLQRDVFRTILRAASRSGGRMLSIHSRNAVRLVLDDLERECGASVPVMHWFSGSELELEAAVARRCWFSVGPAMLASKRGRFLATLMPKDRVLPETDGPFGQMDGAPLMPWHAELALPILAQVWNLPLDEVQEQMRWNLKNLGQQHIQGI